MQDCETMHADRARALRSYPALPVRRLEVETNLMVLSGGRLILEREMSHSFDDFRGWLAALTNPTTSLLASRAGRFITIG